MTTSTYTAPEMQEYTCEECGDTHEKYSWAFNYCDDCLTEVF